MAHVAELSSIMFIDKQGSQNIESGDEDEETEIRNPIMKKLLMEYKSNMKETVEPQPSKSNKKSTLEELADSIDWERNKKKRKGQVKDFDKKLQEKPSIDIQKVLSKSVITPDFENLHTVPTYEESERKAKLLRKIERVKTKGKKWFGLPATEMTEEIENDLKVLQMRSALDGKRFYKKNDLKVLPKYFQVGKVMDSSLDFHNRLTNKERKRTLVEELLADAEFNKYNKRKYKEIIEEKQKTHYKAYRQAKKLKRKKK